MEVIFHRLAIQEYLSARRWYAARSIRLAQAFQTAVDEAVQQIASMPNLGTRYNADHRWVRLRRFPYLLYYTAVSDDRIVIMAVAHSRRRPGYWRRRRPGS